MPESITQSETDHNGEAIEHHSTDTNQVGDAFAPASVHEAQRLIIWTPRFIILFAILLIVGLSAASLLTEGWSNTYYSAQGAELLYTAIAFCCWAALLLFTRSSLWVRLGAIFSMIWLLFTAATLFVTLLIPSNQTHSILSQILAARNSALLGSCLCLSISHTTFRRWDTWFFRLAPTITVISIFIAYYHSPSHTLRDVENSTALVVLYLGVCTWWLRPSCWRTQPGPLFLLGGSALLQLIFAIISSRDGEKLLFFMLVLLLLSILGSLRLLQYELQYTRRYLRKA